MSYFQKYLKYKNKYLELKKQIGGAPKFKVDDVVIVDRRKIGKIRNVYTGKESNIQYNIEYVSNTITSPADRSIPVPYVGENPTMVDESRLIIKPQIIPNRSYILRPGLDVVYKNSTVQIDKIRDTGLDGEEMYVIIMLSSKNPLHGINVKKSELLIDPGVVQTL
jgi:hypothetical protein